MLKREAKLSASELNAFWLFEGVGMQYKDIAQEMGCGIASIKKFLSRARQKVGKMQSRKNT
jgi:DNA-directed RNA polymerase specialized sigma24 family protein